MASAQLLAHSSWTGTRGIGDPMSEVEERDWSEIFAEREESQREPAVSLENDFWLDMEDHLKGRFSLDEAEIELGINTLLNSPACMWLRPLGRQIRLCGKVYDLSLKQVRQSLERLLATKKRVRSCN